MAQYTIYDVASGEIQRSGDHPDLNFLRANIAEGLAVYEGEALDDMSWRIEDGAPVARVALPSRAALLAAVETERARRLAAGFDYDFGPGRGVHRIGTTESDMRGWDDVTQLASALNATGQSAATINILTDTGPVTVTAQEWPSVLIAAGAFRQPIWAASFALSAMAETPADYADDHHWT